jgi:NADPH-dependent ferric siderophore reductase
MCPSDSVLTRLRREPPRFRAVEVLRTTPLTKRMTRVTLHGSELDGFAVDEPAASIRLLLPSRGAELEIPTWNGNEFLLADGNRPVIRTFTPRAFDPARAELDLDIVLHGRGAASEWAGRVGAGARVAVSGPGRGYTIDPHTPEFVLAGDESALPAMGQLLEWLPATAAVHVIAELIDVGARLELPAHPLVTIEWCQSGTSASAGEALLTAVRATELAPRGRIWAAGEAAAMQRLRKYLFEERGLPRAQTTIRGYWKYGRAGGDADER